MQESVSRPSQSRAIPFDTTKLDALMDAAGMDVLVATSKHNVQYLLDAERAIFFDYMDALGVSRYLPVLIYPKGAPEKAGYVGNPLEAHQRAVVPLWVPEVQNKSMGSVDAITRAVDIIRKSGVPAKRIGVEQILHIVLRGRDQEVDARLFHQAVELGGIKRNGARLAWTADAFLHDGPPVGGCRKAAFAGIVFRRPDAS